MPPVTISVGIPADSLRRRPTFAPPNSAHSAQSAQIGVAELQFYPAISISGTFGGPPAPPTATISRIFSSHRCRYAGGPVTQMEHPELRGQITDNVRLQDATLQQLLVDYQRLVLMAQRQLPTEFRP